MAQEKRWSWCVVALLLYLILFWLVVAKTVFGAAQVTVSWPVTLKDITDGYLKTRVNTISDYDGDNFINLVDFTHFARGDSNKRVVEKSWWLGNTVYYPEGMSPGDKQKLWQTRKKLQTSGVPGDINVDGVTNFADYAWILNRKDIHIDTED